MSICKHNATLVIIMLLIAACTTGIQTTDAAAGAVEDPHSYAKPEMALINKLNLNLNVDFEKKELAGYAEYEITAKSTATEIIFDTHYLQIDSSLANGKRVTFALGEEDKILGTPLRIPITGETRLVRIYYKTTDNAQALQWLQPEQTHDKKYPFLFTQSQAILARTWIPIQDSPGIKITYTATISCPKNLLALMSASNPTQKNEGGVYHFTMEQPVSPYLMALAVGDVVYHPYNTECGVYAEPGMIERVSYEFESMPQMITEASNLYGKYAWGKYDVIVLPPSFPFGGMENPRLTFATPTVVAGDRSLTALVAHELAHSWSGNLVTNQTWNDFWLNEGFTTYFENRIMEKVYGKRYSDMLLVLGYRDLKNTIEELKETPNDQHLLLNLAGRDPDEGMSDIAYEKGRLFLIMLEKKSGREKFDAFLKKYFTENKFKSMNTAGFLQRLKTDLLNNDESLYKNYKIAEWINQPGIPDNAILTVSDELGRVGQEFEKFNATGNAAGIDTTGFTTHHWLQLLNQLDQTTGIEKMKALDAQFKFTNSTNAEIQFAWYMAALKNNYSKADEAIERYLLQVGRRKFVRPLFAQMCKTPEGKARAVSIFAKAKTGYHSVTAISVEEILNK
ncbi:MAG: M1 family metallopeptidase [Bacteroidetes bacterium]|nr:M1 family metallopeptidase [Bacteroidota bacterium]